MSRVLTLVLCVVGLSEVLAAASQQQRRPGPPGADPALPPSTFQTPAAASSKVDVVTLDGKTVNVALGDFTRHVVTTSDHGTKVTFEGVLLRDVLTKAGAPLGDQLHGPAALTRFVKVIARDGYAVVFSIAELDSGFTDEIVLLADVRDGKRLVADAGPLQIVTPHEKRGGRWIRQVSKIEIREAK